MIWYSKTDVQSAFRVLPTKPGLWWLMIMKAEHPETGEIFYFIDKCLPFGHSISCALFQSFSDALAHIHRFLTRNLSPMDTNTNYLDDFLFAALTRALCNELMQKFLDLCKKIGLPIADEKTEWSSMLMVFLGILLDGRKQILAIPEEKRLKALNQLCALVDRKKATVKELESLAGLLNFLHKAIVPGRAFTCRMYSKFSGKNLKQYHHTRLDGEFKADCKMWISFLCKNDAASLYRPYVDFTESLTAETLDMVTDVVKGINLGMGGVFATKWFYAKWEPKYIEMFDPSIEYLELLGLCTAVYIWTPAIRNKRIILFCDNQSVVSIVNNSSSSCRNCMHLVRLLVRRCMDFNCRVFAKWVKGSLNVRSDLLSRQKISKFKWLTAKDGRKAEDLPEELPGELWPASRIWVK